MRLFIYPVQFGVVKVAEHDAVPAGLRRRLDVVKLDRRMGVLDVAADVLLRIVADFRLSGPWRRPDAVRR